MNFEWVFDNSTSWFFFTFVIKKVKKTQLVELSKNSPNMNFEWVFDNSTSWFFFTFFITNQSGIAEHLDACFIRKNCILPIFTFMSFCPSNSSFFSNRSEKWGSFRYTNSVTKLPKDFTNCTRSYIKLWVSIIKRVCDFKACCSSTRVSKLTKVAQLFWT